jgi:tetratricopeptide (TPR) repeat protein
MRQIHRTDVGRDTIEQLTVITEQLCCDYVARPAAELREDAQRQLEYVARLLNSPTSLREHRELLVISGWLSLLIGCVNYDLGDERRAEAARVAAQQLGREAGHGEIVAWSCEMSAWFALTQGRYRSILDFSEAGREAAPHASVAIQLVAQAAKGFARLGDRSQVRRTLDQGAKLLEQHGNPERPQNHFVVDPTKWDFYAMDCYRIVGENERAAEQADEVLRLSARPDGSDRSPMRASEARLTLATVAVRDGDLDAAAEWARKGFTADRKSVKTLAMVAEELHHEVRAQYGNDPATNGLNEVIRSFYETTRDH